MSENTILFSTTEAAKHLGIGRQLLAYKVKRKQILPVETIQHDNHNYFIKSKYKFFTKEEINKELSNKKPRVGDISTEYPYGYGFCQCGCHKKSYRIKGGYRKYKKLHLPERIALIKEKEKQERNRLKNKERIKLWQLKNKDILKAEKRKKDRAKAREKYHRNIELSRKNAREETQLYRFKNKEKLLVYWRNYSKKNRKHRSILEKQSRLRSRQTKKYFYPKLIRTLKKIINIKKVQEIAVRKKERALTVLKKQILYGFISVLKKIKKKKYSQENLIKRKEKEAKKVQKKKETFLYKENLQSQMKRPLKRVIGVFRSKLRLTYGNTQKLHEYLLWYINTPKICDFCGIPEDFISKNPHPGGFSNHSVLEIDKKNPFKKYTLDNIHLVCPTCNSVKLHNLTCEEMKEIGLRFILNKWKNLYIPRINKKFKLIRHPEHLKDKIQFPKEYSIWIRLKKRAQKIGKKLPYLSFKELLSWYKSQDKKCVYCGISETLLNTYKIKPIFSWCSDRLTIDRISPIDGYLPKNIVLSCLACNTIKSNIFTFEEMKEIGLLLKKKWQQLIKGDLNV